MRWRSGIAGAICTAAVIYVILRYMDPTVISPTVQEFRGQRYWPTKGGYYRRRGKWLHREVWTAAHGPIPPGHHVHHEDENRANNTLANLRPKEGGAHLREHWPPEKRAAAAARMRARQPSLQAKATKAHRSPAGRAMHSAVAKETWAAAPTRTLICQQCGKPYQTRTLNQQTKFCHPNCKAKALRARRALLRSSS
jgi:hypothetical protein